MAFNPDVEPDDEGIASATTDDDMSAEVPRFTRAILIVPSPANTVTPVDIQYVNGRLAITEYVGAHVVSTHLPDGHVLYVNGARNGAHIGLEEGAGFMLYPSVFHAGVGLLLGPPDDDGCDTAATRSLVAVLNDITWRTQ